MKLLKCHIENFGNLANYNYEFKEGLNVINKPNGFGKSTFASFIKAMFYGLEGGTKRASLTDRKRYLPWQGGTYGGSIEFEKDEKEYRIERTFGAKEQEDTFMLYDLTTNLQSTDYTDNIGEEIFKINKEAYERSTYVPSQNIQIKMNDSLNAKLGNILEGENDVNTSELAIKKLEEAMKVFKKTGERGLINETKAKILEVERKIERGKSEERAIEERRIRLEETKKKIENCEKSKEELQKQLKQRLELESKQAKKQNYDLILKKYQENIENIENLKNFFKGEIPTDEELDILFEKCIQVEKYKVEVQSYELTEEEKKNIMQLKNAFESKDITEDIINKKITEVNEIKDIENKIENTKQNQELIEKSINDQRNSIALGQKLNVIYLILAILFVFGGIAILVLNILSKILAIGLIFIGLIVSFVWSLNKSRTSRAKKKYLDKQEERQSLSEVLKGLEAKKSEMERQINEFLLEYLQGAVPQDKIIALTEIKSKLVRYRELEDKINIMINKKSDSNNKLNLLQESIKEYLEKYYNDVVEPYSKLAQDMKTKKNEFNRLLLSLDQSRLEKEEYEKINDISKLRTSLEEENLFNKEEIERNLRLLDIQLNSLNDEKLSNKNQIDRLETSLDELADAENELEELKQKLEDDEKKFKILSKTKDLLKNAKESFSSHYLNKMEKGFEKYINLIDNISLEADIDINLNVKLEQNGYKKDSAYFSTGYQDLIYLCIRFSLIDALFEEESPFVVLDDPFVNLDKEKIQNCVDLINKISEKYQIIYFVCHDSRA